MGLKLAAGGGGRFRLGQNSDINVTPLVDVMLVLLIIFMVALPAPVTTLPLNLPPAKAPAGPVDPPTIINIQTGGGLLIGERPTSLDRLGADLAREIKKPRPTEEQVFVRADRKVRYKQFMAVMDTLHAAGFLKVGLVNEEL